MFITANDFGNGNSYADGSQRTSCQAQKKRRVAFPGLSTQVPQPHSVAGHFLPLTDTGVGKGLGAELALKETEFPHLKNNPFWLGMVDLRTYRQVDLCESPPG